MAALPRQDAGPPYDEETASSAAEQSGEPRSTMELLRNVVLHLTHIVEDSTDLVGASIREELAQFRQDLARHALAIATVVIGATLASAGVAMLVARWLESWPATLLILGAVYLGFAAGLYWGRGEGPKS